MTDETEFNALHSGGEEKNGVGVKPLEWHGRLKTGEREGFVCSEGGVLSYSIMLSRFRVYGIPGEHDGAAEFLSLGEAKAAAQADYERRILSALTNTDLSLRAENERLRKERDAILTDFHTTALALGAAEAKLEEAAKVLEPFAAHDWVDDIGWNNVACQNDRICDWFGPSDFRAAKSFLANLKGAE